jgi:hypothetical protein
MPVGQAVVRRKIRKTITIEFGSAVGSAEPKESV